MQQHSPHSLDELTYSVPTVHGRQCTKHHGEMLASYRTTLDAKRDPCEPSVAWHYWATPISRIKIGLPWLNVCTNFSLEHLEALHCRVEPVVPQLLCRYGCLAKSSCWPKISCAQIITKHAILILLFVQSSIGRIFPPWSTAKRGDTRASAGRLSTRTISRILPCWHSFRHLAKSSLACGSSLKLDMMELFWALRPAALLSSSTEM